MIAAYSRNNGLATYKVNWGVLFCSVCLMGLVCAAQALAADAPCLDRIYSKDESRRGTDYDFDVSFDSATRHHRSLSCGPEIRASEARKALDLFRNGVLYRNGESISSVLRFPLRVGITKTLRASERPEIIMIRNAQEWFAFQGTRLSPMHIALISCSQLATVTVEGGQSPGFRIGAGFVWFQNSVKSEQVKVTSMNVFPIDEKMLISACVP